ncbi:hypothetical protein Ddye_005143 [Dipteronia dyeriana]|uniref:Xylanase inhibitor N-terminal domain-containing protein n=1 Tax=Dipteronia dyeriana TaxID=168575 RepID=A0AAD9XFX7_9ROSI|nr:hypothetical protein Ddye_005143 [Dipteronia dyeriana]
MQDKLTFPSADRKSKVVVNDYMFRCGENNRDVDSDGSIGLMGLSRSSISFVYQMVSMFQKYFLHCLPSDYISASLET